MSKINPNAQEKIDAYIEKKDEQEQAIIKAIREVARDTVVGIEEDYKWSWPCLHYHGLVCSFGAHKSHMAIHFFQGALLDDKAGVLNGDQKNNAAMRTWRFSKEEPLDLELFKVYLKEAAANNKAGKKVDLTKTRKPLEIPPSFKKVLESNEVWNVFDGMSYSHRKEYLEYFTQAKREETKERRMKKVVELLKVGSGLNDKYK